MNWFVEHLHRDGTVLARLRVTGMDFSIGRALDNALVLNDPHCAPHHAQLRIADDGTAELHDLGSKNGIRAPRGKRQSSYPIASDAIYNLGSSHIRIRNSAWALAPELALSHLPVWTFAVLALALVLGHGAWNLWLNDLSDKTPPYLSTLSGIAAVMCVWSAMYALLGRILTGVDRFFTHLLIVSCAYLGATLIDNGLQLLAFASAWLWPMRISQHVMVFVLAFTIRAHLRVADPRHWPKLRWAVAAVALLSVIVPLAQRWLSEHRLTNIQILNVIEHPALRLAPPQAIDGFIATSTRLKERADQDLARDDGETDDETDED
jgi:hypothetical protein